MTDASQDRVDPPLDTSTPLDAPAEPPEIELASARTLLALAFDLLGRSGPEMRRASFYIGSVVLGTVAPLALGSLAVGVRGVELPSDGIGMQPVGVTGLALSLAGLLALAGVMVATVESRIVAMSVLAGRMVGRPLGPRRALARSRRVFWRALAATIVASVPLVLANGIVNASLASLPGDVTDLSVITTTVVGATIGAPFAYTLAGVVLGDVGPIEAIRRSFRVFRARKLAAAVVVTFETLAAILIVLGIGIGLDLAIRIAEVLGIGLGSGPLGLAAVTAGLIVGVFAVGTLLFTVTALTVSPQVAMFIGLTHASLGLDTVRPGGRDDPGVGADGRTPRVRAWTRPMLAAFGLGAVLLAIIMVDTSA